LDVTNDAAISWSSSVPEIATITTSQGSSGNGIAKGVSLGTTTITASGLANGVEFSDSVTLEVTDAVVSSLVVTPSSVNVLKGQTQPLVAMATYSDLTSADISSSVTWQLDTNIATVDSAGLLSGVEVGSTTLTATKDGVSSNTVDVNVCNLAGPCIDVFDTGSGKLFTNSPSVTYLDSIGGSATNGTHSEGGVFGPAGDFYLFYWDNANALCATYNTNSVGGRTNWRLATRDELSIELYDVYGNMFTARGWPTNYMYWTETPISTRYYFVNLNTNGSGNSIPDNEFYASCVSDP
ncbi:Ig-like domain-containing protein, partial [Vibrio parahaemolyticus]|nr:Ig-like domain-containing protein [Vibrio parahaemolyticus]